MMMMGQNNRRYKQPSLYEYFFMVIRVLFSVWNQFLIKVGIKSAPPPPKPSMVNLTDEYINKMRTLFLEGKWAKNPGKNANIKKDVYDLKRLETILSDADNDLEKEWGSRALVENTPRGNMVMMYDIFNQRFNYYSDTVMPHKLLNAVAMKYVSIFQCRDFFIDDWVLAEPSPLANMCDVRPKRYDTRAQQVHSTKTQDKINGLSNVRAANDLKKMNVFSHKGKFGEYGMFTKVNKNKVEPPKEAKMGFAEYNRFRLNLAAKQCMERDGVDQNDVTVQSKYRAMFSDRYERRDDDDDASKKVEEDEEDEKNGEEETSFGEEEEETEESSINTSDLDIDLVSDISS